ncbi:hypothetical protein [Paenibacillus periandrae]|nr:hypothetical protein [Paenibacillus periandrae]
MNEVDILFASTLDNGTYVSRHYQPPNRYGKQSLSSRGPFMA